MRGEFKRSEESLEFERLWRALPRSGGRIVPFLCDFLPEKAPHFLSDLVLLEVDAVRPPYLKVRLAGHALFERARFEMAGTDYATYLPEEYRPGAVRSADVMVCRPCGLWQIMPFYKADGAAQFVEITCLPLLGKPGRKPMLLTLVKDRGRAQLSAPPVQSLVVDTAFTYTYLDIGAGVPLLEEEEQAGTYSIAL